MNRTYTLADLQQLHRTDFSGVRAMVKRGEYMRVRRNAYVQVLEDEPKIDYLALVRATWLQLRPGSVLSHDSAAELHGLPLWQHQPEHVCITRNGTGKGRKQGGLHLRRCTLSPEDCQELDGLLVTNLARTAVDLARTLPFDAAVGVMDAALAKGCTREDLQDVHNRMRLWPGAGTAARAIAFADPLAESVAESVSRVRIRYGGLPDPELQYVVRDNAGHFVGRFDMAWPELQVLGECDGVTKYDERANAGETPGEIVLATTRRDRAAGELDWRVVHWGVAEIKPRSVLARRLSPYLMRPAA